MTAKEKAIKLVEKFEPYVNYQKDDLINEIERMRINAKQCALICVDEILTFIKDADPQSLSYELMGYRDYWQEVKQQIKKL